MSIWRVLATTLCILALTLPAFAQEEPAEEEMIPPAEEDVMVEEPVVEEMVVEEPVTEPAPEPGPTAAPTAVPVSAPACRLALGNVTPPDDSVVARIRVLSGAWEGTLTGNPFWLTVERLTSGDAAVFYGQPAVGVQRAYEARATAQVRGDGRLEWNQPGVGMYQLSLTSNAQRMTGDFAGVNGLLTNLSLARCAPR